MKEMRGEEKGGQRKGGEGGHPRFFTWIDAYDNNELETENKTLRESTRVLGRLHILCSTFD